MQLLNLSSRSRLAFFSRRPPFTFTAEKRKSTLAMMMTMQQCDDDERSRPSVCRPSVRIREQRSVFSISLSLSSRILSVRPHDETECKFMMMMSLMRRLAFSLLGHRRAATIAMKLLSLRPSPRRDACDEIFPYRLSFSPSAAAADDDDDDLELELVVHRREDADAVLDLT